MKNVDYSAAIIYFKNLIKYLNVKETISITEIILLDNYFEKWCKKIKNMILVQKCLKLLK